jgi:hypothetical protein
MADARVWIHQVSSFDALPLKNRKVKRIGTRNSNEWADPTQRDGGVGRSWHPSYPKPSLCAVGADLVHGFTQFADLRERALQLTELLGALPAVQRLFERRRGGVVHRLHALFPIHGAAIEQRR